MNNKKYVHGIEHAEQSCKYEANGKHGLHFNLYL